MECPDCGAENSESATFCGLCLTRFESETLNNAPRGAAGTEVPRTVDAASPLRAAAVSATDATAAIAEAKRLSVGIDELIRAGNYDAALPIADRVVGMLEAVHIMQGIHYWRALEDAAWCAMSTDRTDDAIEYLARMLRSMEGHAEAHASYLQGLSNQAALLHKRGDIDSALALRELAVRLTTNATGSNTSLLVRELLDLAVSLADARQFDEASARLAEAVHLIHAGIGDASPAMADAYSVRGRILLGAEQHEEGMGWLREAARLDRALPKRDVALYLEHLSLIAARVDGDDHDNLLREIRSVPGATVEVGGRDENGLHKISIAYRSERRL